MDDVLPRLYLNRAEKLPWVRAQLPAGFRDTVADGPRGLSPTVAAALGAAVVRVRPGVDDAPTRPDTGRMAQPAPGFAAEGAAGSATVGDRGARLTTRTT
jgi:hypothetical protein